MPDSENKHHVIWAPRSARSFCDSEIGLERSERAIVHANQVEAPSASARSISALIMHFNQRSPCRTR